MQRSDVRPSLRPSVYSSVCTVDRQQQRSAAGLLLSAAYQLSIDICCRRPRSAANAGNVMLRARGQAQHRLVISPQFVISPHFACDKCFNST